MKHKYKVSVLLWVCKKPCTRVSWLAPGDFRHCHLTNNIGYNSQNINSGFKHTQTLKKWVVISISRYGEWNWNPRFPSGAGGIWIFFFWHKLISIISLILWLASVSPHPKWWFSRAWTASNVPRNIERGNWNKRSRGWCCNVFLPSAHPPAVLLGQYLRNTALLLIFVPNPALYWRGKWAGIDSSSGFSALQRAKPEKQSQGKLWVCFAGLELLVDFQVMGVRTLWVSPWDWSSNPINQDQANPQGLA